MLLPPIATCEDLLVIIAFRSKFPALHKIIMKNNYSFWDRSYCIVTVIGSLKIQNWEAHIPNVFSTALLRCEII